jgi:poly(ADP-ribose) glycohydrolase ARH3
MKTGKGQFEFILLGLALGDALDDDTQMSLDLTASLIENGRIVEDDIARRFAAGYHWQRGYGPGAAKALKRIRRGMPWRQASRSVFAAGSFGNGAARRAPVVGIFYRDQPEMLEDACQRTAVLTHAHALAIDGTRLIAHATAFAACQTDAQELMNKLLCLRLEPAFERPLMQGQQWLGSGYRPTPDEVAAKLGNGISAITSTPSAIFVALSFLNGPFTDMVSFVCKGGGDTYTIAVMAGAIWGAANSYYSLPSSLLTQLEQAPAIRKVAVQLFTRHQVS